jgi:transcription-repair coupling factor (superfamily II helicase)
MPRLTDFLSRLQPFRDALAVTEAGDVLFRAPSFVHPFLAAGLLARPPWRERPCLVVAPHQDGAESLRRELALYLPDRRVLHLPARGVWYGPEGEVPPRVAARRGQALAALSDPAVVVVEATTLMEGALPGCGPSLQVAVGSRVEFEPLLEQLVDLGYSRVDQVEDAGEFAVRGGLVDIFPASDQAPVRVEFWGDEVESIRSFSVYSQRSLATLDEVDVVAAAEAHGVAPRPVTSFLGEEARVILVDPGGARVRVEAFRADLDDVFGPEGDSATDRGDGSALEPEVESRTHHEDGRVHYLEWTDARAALSAYPTVTMEGGAPSASAQASVPEFVVRASAADLPVTSLPEAEREIERLAGKGFRVVVAFESRAEAERAVYMLKRLPGRPAGPSDIPESVGVTYLPVGHRRHFMLPEIGLAVLTDAQIFPRRHKATTERRLVVGAELSSFRDLRKGDYVVHEDHGVGRFEGLSTKTVAGVTRDYLDIAFRDSDMLYIPHDQIEKVSRYVGAHGSPPALSKLGGKAWEQVKNRARRAVREMAGELLQLYALRATADGHPFPDDGEWQLRFERAFPYQETDDQLRTIDEVKDDMERSSPMDRLICGDVGYGKTEVALRASFKAAMEGSQVMVLVPTTILAQQHYGTFRERFSEFPARVEMVSRFRTPREQRRILSEFADGKIDVLIGTHRLLSADVSPKDLGLVIVDEEQRFGVAQKEALRNLKLRVDVLTLSATPIPRTLQMSLAGVRDISVIETPPRDRHPIQTFVGLYDEGIIARAIEREIARGGQVFYLHNRVETIDRAVARLSELVPTARLAVAHGQMPEQALERVMLGFLRRDYDVLVTTTIIESGLDIPNANTLIVERADLLGLAQLYQIRGRIGRSSRLAHAYLFHPDEAALTADAVSRLSTLADYTELGSGFKIAMRDLEIRGAGNLLGGEQSGHIAAIGFEMYLSMLKETVQLLQGLSERPESVPRVDVALDAFVPSDFIAYEAAKVDLHRRIAAATRSEELSALREELGDRFGSLPEPVDHLIFLGEVRVAVQALSAQSFTCSCRRVHERGCAVGIVAMSMLRPRGS